jgi:hypothetical protein
MKEIVKAVIENTDWLYVKIYESPLIFFDLWSFVHVWSGIVLIALIIISNVKHKWVILFSILTLYEVFEILIVYFTSVFRVETIKDQITDIVIGMAGGYLCDKTLKYFFRNKEQKKNFFDLSFLVAALTAITIAFLWVGFYRYEYNFNFLNSKGINYYALSLWFFIILIILLLYRNFSKKLKTLPGIIAIWTIYFLSLSCFEFIFYHIVGIRESGNHSHNPLIFDIIHGSKVLHIFYLSLPFISVGLFLMFSKFFNYAIHNGRELKKKLSHEKKTHSMVAEKSSFQSAETLGEN